MANQTLFESAAGWLSRRRMMKYLKGVTNWRTVVRFRGCSFFADGNNKIEAALLRGDRQYDGNNFTAISHFVRPGSVCFDVGANIGVYSSVLAGISGDPANIHSFEPVEHVRRKLIANARLNGFGNIHVNPFALGSSPGTLVMHQIREGHFRGGTSTFVNKEIVTRLGQSQFESREVEIRTLDQYVGASDLSRVDFIKIDVEGFELEVLKGAIETLSKHKPTMILEYDEDRHSPEAGTMREVLSSIGYQVFEFAAYRDTLVLQPFDFERPPRNRNILCWHPPPE
jgi:FkbM family methyltransferase